MKKAKCIMMITSLKQPVPAVGGGAIQTLITTLLDENEIHKKFRFIVISVSNKKAEAYHYNYSRIYFCHRGIIKCGFLPLTYAVCYFFKLLGKCEKTVRKIFGVIPANKESIAINSFFMQCCRIAKKEKVDLVICEGTMNPPQYERFHRIVGRDNLFYHLHCHKTEDLSVRNAVPNSIAISQFVKKEWAITPISGSRNIVLYNGIDIEGFSTEITKEQRKALRNRYGVLDDEFLAVYCGRIVPVKGVEELLKAFQLLKGHPVKLLLIGSVAFSDDTTTDFSERMASFADSMDLVIRLGYVPNEEMPRYYKMADFQIIPSIWQEGAGLVAIEGMASGLPLIITDSGGMVEYVSDECAIKVPINDELPENLAAAVLRLIDDRELMKRMGEKGIERARLFTKEKYYSDFAKAFSDDRTN